MSKIKLQPDWWRAHMGTAPEPGTTGDDGDRRYDAVSLRPASPCLHDCRRPALTLTDGRVLYGGQGGTLSVWSTPVDHLDLIIDCAGFYKRKPFVKGKMPSRRWAPLRPLDRGPEVLQLDWPDMTAPTHVGIRFWTQLLQLLPKHTAVCCMGGHGRTGTALAALLIADGVSPVEAISRVRSQHCPKAIETASQEAYLKGLKG
jgi:hypothetical protein